MGSRAQFIIHTNCVLATCDHKDLDGRAAYLCECESVINFCSGHGYFFVLQLKSKVSYTFDVLTPRADNLLEHTITINAPKGFRQVDGNVVRTGACCGQGVLQTVRYMNVDRISA